MTLRIHGSLTATIEAQQIIHRPNVMGYDHHYHCVGINAVQGALQPGISLTRDGNFSITCPVANVNNAANIRVRWSQNNTVCDLYVRMNQQ